jgi:hypothetical protein
MSDTEKHNLVPLRDSDISPPIIIQELQKNQDEMEEIFVVTFNREGESFIYMSGDIRGMVYAAHVLDEMAREIARGAE